MSHILIVEDNETNREGLSRLLVKRGHTVTSVEDGATAVSMALSIHPDLILMDLSIPVVDGFDATRLIRAAETKHGFKPITIIALTAHAMQQDRLKAKEAGCNDFETKPINITSLLSKISLYL